MFTDKRYNVKNCLRTKYPPAGRAISKAALAADILGEERFAQSLTLDDLKFLFAE